MICNHALTQYDNFSLFISVVFHVSFMRKMSLKESFTMSESDSFCSYFGHGQHFESGRKLWVKTKKSYKQVLILFILFV